MNQPPFIDEFSKAVGIPIQFLLSRSRKQEFIDARFVYYYLAGQDYPD